MVVNSKIWSSLLPLVLMISLVGCENNRIPSKVYIYQTSDVHGALFPHDFVNDDTAYHSLAQVHRYISARRDSLSVLLLDNGDILQGQPTVYYSNFIDTSGKHILSRVMNYMDYEAATVGNHDIEAGHPVYDRLVDEFDFPWLAANVANSTTGDPYFQPYVMVLKEGLRIAILGLTTPSVTSWLPQHLWAGLEFNDVLESAKYWVNEITEQEEADLVVGLFHFGTGETDGEYNNGLENAASIIAREVPGFDLIFCGHDHRETKQWITNNEGNNVLLLNPGGNARFLSSAVIEFEKRRSGRIRNLVLDGEIIDVSTLPVDGEFMETFSQDIRRVESYVDQPVGNLTGELSARESLFGDAAFTDLIHRVQLDLTGADISFTAPLSSNAYLAPGEIEVRDLFSIYRFENYLYVMAMSGMEIKNYLEYSYGRWMNMMATPEDNLLNYTLDEKGKPVISERYNSYQFEVPPYNFDSAEGIRYSIDVSEPVGNRVQISTLLDGRPFHLDSTYLVAINSYRGSGGGGHLQYGAEILPGEFEDRILYSTRQDLRKDMLEWIRSHGSIVPETNNNWILYPASWVDAAVAREKEMLPGRK